MNKFNILDRKVNRNISDPSDAYAVNIQKPKYTEVDPLTPKESLPQVHFRFDSTQKTNYNKYKTSSLKPIKHRNKNALNKTNYDVW